MTRHHFYMIGAVQQPLTAQMGAESMVRFMENKPEDYPDFKLINVSFFSYQDAREGIPMFNAIICYSITEPDEKSEKELPDLDEQILRLRYIANFSIEDIAKRLGVYQEHVIKTLEYYKERQDLLNKKMEKIERGGA